MRCDRAREGLSAQLDGEDPGVSPRALERHVTSCASCRRWHDEAAQVTRLTRMRLAEPGDAVPDLVSRLAPAGRAPRGRAMLRLALLVVAGVQLAIGVTGLLLPLTGGDLAHPVVGGVHLPGMSGHLGNESAAFNIGIGIALGWVAIHPHRSRGPLPLLTAFVVVLAGLSVLDLAVGRVGWDRLAVHLPVVTGLLLAAVLTRVRAPQMPEPADSSTSDAWSEAEPFRPSANIDLPPTGHGPGQRPPAAHRDIAS